MTFSKGDVVESTIDAQGLKRGTRYIVVWTDTVSTPFGEFVTYGVVEHISDVAIPVSNGHLLLRRVGKRS